MITRIEARGYKCLREVDVKLRQFNVLAGPNGSGKSTFLDVPRFLGDALTYDGDIRRAVLARANQLAELTWMVSGEPVIVSLTARRSAGNGSGGHEREALTYVVYVSTDSDGALVVGAEILLAHPEGSRPAMGLVTKLAKHRASARRFDPAGLRVPNGRVLLARAGHTSAVARPAQGRAWRLRPRPDRLALYLVPEEPGMFPEAAWLRQLLRWQITSVELDPAAMRGPCPPEAPRELVRDGSNLAILVHRIAGTERFDWWVEHLRVSLPGVKHVNVAEQAHDRRLYLVVTYENGLKVPSWRLSDGTLRFLGLTLIPCLPPENRVFLVEEPENGIHPQAIELLMQSLTSVHEGQVLVATHSPIVVGVTDPADLLCFSQDDQRATHIEQGSQHPGLAVWKDNLTLADIFAAGILG